MTRTRETTSDRAEVGHVNTVAFRGRVTKVPEERELPSGTVVSTLRISVRRDETPMTRGSKQSSDWFDCTAWTAALRRRMKSWQVGDEVEIVGAVRRRHLGGGSGGTLVDIEVQEARRTQRADSA
ncbi:MAG: single-stranded DNA-binding protein [Myxococcales bacterium]|nr:MAG: single-stranded DNA-binding protein [Myxococcales bacterium]